MMRIKNLVPLLLALVAGMLLSSMMYINSILARHTSAAWASLVAHGIGAIAGLLFWLVLYPKKSIATKGTPTKAPLWAYFGGIPGVIVVILASVTVNSKLALSGSLAIMLLGQVMFGLIVDTTGMFGMPVRRIKIHDLFELITILIGAGVLIFFAR